MERADLELVVAIHRHGSLAKAAAALGVTPSAVTRRLALLETALGLRLFQRTTRRVAATAEGETVVRRATDLLQGFQALASELRERRAEATGPIRLVATLGFGRHWVGPAVAAFQQRHPAVTIHLQLTERLPDLAAEGYDAAIWLWSAPSRRAGEWVSRRLAPNERVLVASPDYLAAHGTPQTLDDLAQHPCLRVSENTTRDAVPDHHWSLQRSGERDSHRVTIGGPLSSNAGELVRDWCLAGHGIMLRSLWDIGPALASGALVRVLPDWSQRDADVHWIAPWRASVPRRLDLLRQHLQKTFRGQPWGRDRLLTG